MAHRLDPIRLGARLATLVLALIVAACVASTPDKAAAPDKAEMEAQLRQQAKIMQKSILEGAAVGALGGAGLDLIFNFGGDDDTQTAIKLGAGAGALAGSYVGHLQTKYFTREKRLEAIRADLDRNAAEMQTTINVMRQVMQVQRAELAGLRARVDAGTASREELSAELEAANANLAEMQKAIDGAAKRESEFGDARGLTLKSGETASPVDPELAALANQVATMKVIAYDLATEI